jgi:hypothetical protein
MTADDFRRFALGLPEAVEQGHMGHPDFRVGGKIFASLDHSGAQGCLKLTPEHQEMLVEAEPGLFEPAAGYWGRKGWTYLKLAAADEGALHSVLTASWLNTAPQALVKAFKGAST